MEQKERDFRASVGLAVLGLEIIAYGLLTYFGDENNDMHTSAQTGMLWGAHLVLLGLGVITTLLPTDIFKR